jgi:hypothetical protein
MNHLQSDSMPLCCPAPLRQGVADLVRKGGRFTPKGRPICSESLAFLLRNTHSAAVIVRKMKMGTNKQPTIKPNRSWVIVTLEILMVLFDVAEVEVVYI